jgi:hypothetical protein
MMALILVCSIWLLATLASSQFDEQSGIPACASSCSYTVFNSIGCLSTDNPTTLVISGKIYSALISSGPACVQLGMDFLLTPFLASHKVVAQTTCSQLPTGSYRSVLQ